MKKLMLAVLFLLSHQAASVEPLDVVNSRMDAYNKHDINCFLKTYAEDIQIFTFPNKPLGAQGKAHLREIFEPMFKVGNAKVKVHHQITQGKYVVNHETVSYQGETQKYVSIYEVEKGLIKSVQFIRE